MENLFTIKLANVIFGYKKCKKVEDDTQNTNTLSYYKQ